MSDFNFEQSLKELEAIVKKLESGNVNLDESIKLYQRGLELYRTCYKQLQEAEDLIVKIHEDEEMS